VYPCMGCRPGCLYLCIPLYIELLLHAQVDSCICGV
jgi:hypothetical protein